jgi:tetratricopeptide (TPR) repeat protein
MIALIAVALALQSPELELARKALQAQDADSAIAHYERALESADEAAAAAIEGLLAEALKSRSRYQEALSHVEAGLRRSDAFELDEEYASHGNKARALQRAMQHTRELYPEPRYWAGFGLLGPSE